MIKRTLKRTAILITAAVVIGAVIFVFARPMLAPGFDLKILGINSNSSNDSQTGTFPVNNTESEIGKDVQAGSYLIYDETSGEVLASRNPDSAVAIASITKLMTAYVVQKYGNLDDTWAINNSSTIDIRPVLGLNVGDVVKVNDLVNAMLIGSANDAAAALGAYITSLKDESIINLMNAEAKKLGMSSTHYENPIGFDSEQNYSTADDLKVLLEEIRPLTLFSSIDRRQSYSFTSEAGQKYSVKATNTLLANDPDIHAIKTGYTDEARGAMITAVHHNNSKFVIIVLSSPDREADTKLLKAQILALLAS